MSDIGPRLRAIDAFPVEQDGQRLIGLRDPQGYTGSIVLLPLPLVEILTLFDGQNSLPDVQAEIMRRHGELVPQSDIERLIATLDEHGFIESERFAAHREAIDRAFLAASRRPAAHAGTAYAGQGDALRQMMDAFFLSPGGPGAIDWSADGRGTQLRGLVAPHIDFRRGGAGYAWAYRELAERCDADVFVVLGTCHAGMRDPFALAGKDFDTPLGTVPVDRDFVQALAGRAGWDCFGSEIAHRAEHSIEFQAVFLRYLYAGRRDVTIVPVLASFAHEALARGEGPEADPRVPRFLEALGETIAASDRRVAVIAGADLAHVGPRFGDPAPVSSADCARVEREDRAMLETVATGDAGAFFGAVAADGDRRRICGLSPIYALLRVLDGARGDLRHYGQAPDPQALVSFASVALV